MERHEAIVAGAGPTGLAVAAMLRKAGLQTIVLESADAIGARWRTRYQGLCLNTMREFSTLPGHRIPREYGRYPSRDDFVAYLESYAAHHRLEVRFGAEVQRVDRAEGEGDGLWRLQIADSALLAHYVVLATGYDAVPWMPEWARQSTDAGTAERQDQFAGELIHASEHSSPERYRDRQVLVVGAGNTGIDIAGFLIDGGADVSLSMRTPPNVFPREWLGVPLQVSAIPAERMPAWIGDVLGFGIQKLSFGDLSAYGIPRAPEGFQTKFRRQSVGSAVDDGFVAALKAGRTRVVAPVERLEEGEVVLTDGTRMSPDAVICATGYRRGLEPIVGHLGVLLPDGRPTHFNAVPESPLTPRLYFAGFYGAPAGQIRVAPIHARRIARAAECDRAASLLY